MPETDQGATPVPEADDVKQLSQEGTFFVNEDDQGLDVLEGLAQEDRPPLELVAPRAVQPSASIPARSSIEPSLLDALSEVREDLSRRIDALRSSFERELRAEANRERVVDRLHAELQDYKQDLLLKVQKPIFIDLIQLHDDVGKMVAARAVADSDSDESASFIRILESIQTAIEDILYRQGVEPFSLETSEFDPRKQRALSTTPTEDPTLGKTVADRVRKGFAAGEKLIRPELVSVYLLRQPPSISDGQSRAD
jgi:molecular chaperone GrpE